jgi:hypothetical protein
MRQKYYVNVPDGQSITFVLFTKPSDLKVRKGKGDGSLRIIMILQNQFLLILRVMQLAKASDLDII